MKGKRDEIMSRSLQINFSFDTQRELSYWWVLFFERLSSYGFRFANPDAPKGWSYFSFTTANEGETIEGPFRVLWEKVVQEDVLGLAAVFWYRENEYGLTVDFGFQRDPAPNQLAFLLTLPGGDFGSLSLSCAEQYLQAIFQCAKEMFDLCEPFSVEVAWEDSSGYFAPWASLDLPSRKAAGPWERVLHRSDQVICAVPLSNGQQLYYVNPVPIARNIGEWEFVFLHPRSSV